MSTVKANNHQIGQSGTATNNFTLYQPSTPDGTVRLAVGNSGATTGDVLSVSNTGLSVTGTLSATGNVSFDGGTFVFNESGADKDFRIEGDTEPNLFFTDASTDRVGIGTSSPQVQLHLQSSAPVIRLTDTSASTDAEIFCNSTAGSMYLRADHTNVAANSVIGFQIDGSDKMTLDTSGNLGLGVTPSAWGNGKAFEFGFNGNAVWSYSQTDSYFTHNAKFTDTWRYTSTAAASTYRQSAGAHYWNIAPSGTAGNAISFTQAMTLDASGRLGVGETSPSVPLHVKSTDVAFTANTSYDMAIFENGASGLGSVIQIVAATNGVSEIGFSDTTRNVGLIGYDHTNNYMQFVTNSTERVRIGSGGEVYFPGVGTTASAANAFLNNGSTPANQLLRSTSSLRYKTDVETLDHAKADAVLNLRPVWYRSKAEADRKDWSWYGLIAEEVAQVEPRLVHWSYPEDQFETIETQTEIEKTREVEVTPAVLDDEGNVVEPAVTETETYTETETKSERKLKTDAQLAPDGVQYDRLTVMLLDIVKRQNQRIEQLEAKVAALEAQ